MTPLGMLIAVRHYKSQSLTGKKSRRDPRFRYQMSLILTLFLNIRLRIEVSSLDGDGGGIKPINSRVRVGEILIGENDHGDLIFISYVKSLRCQVKGLFIIAGSKDYPRKLSVACMN